MADGRSRLEGQCRRTGEDLHQTGAEQNRTSGTVTRTQSTCCVIPAISYIGYALEGLIR